MKFVSFETPNTGTEPDLILAFRRASDCDVWFVPAMQPEAEVT